MSDKKNETPAETKKEKVAKSPKKSAAKAAAKTAKPKREKPTEPLMTFAFRLPKSESAALHKAAGPAGASRTMRALAAAFVTGDRAQFESIVDEARKLQ